MLSWLSNLLILPWASRVLVVVVCAVRLDVPQVLWVPGAHHRRLAQCQSQGEFVLTLLLVACLESSSARCVLRCAGSVHPQQRVQGAVQRRPRARSGSVSHCGPCLTWSAIDSILLCLALLQHACGRDRQGEGQEAAASRGQGQQWASCGIQGRSRCRWVSIRQWRCCVVGCRRCGHFPAASEPDAGVLHEPAAEHEALAAGQRL